MDLTATASLAVTSFSFYRWLCSNSALAAMAAYSLRFVSCEVTGTFSKQPIAAAELLQLSAHL